MAEMVEGALALGADAVIGIDLDYKAIGSGNMLMVSANGTAVRLT